MIYAMVSFEVKPECRETYIAEAEKLKSEVLKEKGCISYDVHANVAEPNKFFVVERWETQEDLDAHVCSPHVLAWPEIAGPLRVAPPVVEFVTPAQVVKR
jgi:quinol monooxygenase YgiN